MNKNFLLNIDIYLNIIIRKLYYYINKLQFLFFIILFNIKLLINSKTLPYKITIKLNNNCNLACNYCKIWENKKKSILNFIHLKKLLKEYSKNIKILSFTGGEIFLLDDIKEKIIYSIKNCKNINIFSLTTNGYFTKKILDNIEQILKEINNTIIIINISIDGDNKLHNQLRGNNNSYKNAINTYNKLIKLQKKFPNLEVNQEFLLNEKNFFLLKEKIKNKNIIISIVQNSEYYGINNIKNNINLVNKNIINKTKGYLNKKFLKGYLNKKYNCYAIKSSLFIDWNGDIKPCIIWNKILGNIKNNNINNDIKKNKYEKIKNKIKNKKCPGCWTPCEGYLSIIHEFWK